MKVIEVFGGFAKATNIPARTPCEGARIDCDLHGTKFNYCLRQLNIDPELTKLYRKNTANFTLPSADIRGSSLIPESESADDRVLLFMSGQFNWLNETRPAVYESKEPVNSYGAFIGEIRTGDVLTGYDKRYSIGIGCSGGKFASYTDPRPMKRAIIGELTPAAVAEAFNNAFDLEYEFEVVVESVRGKPIFRCPSKVEELQLYAVLDHEFGPSWRGRGNHRWRPANEQDRIRVRTPRKSWLKRLLLTIFGWPIRFDNAPAEPQAIEQAPEQQALKREMHNHTQFKDNLLQCRVKLEDYVLKLKRAVESAEEAKKDFDAKSQHADEMAAKDDADGLTKALAEVAAAGTVWQRRFSIANEYKSQYDSFRPVYMHLLELAEVGQVAVDRAEVEVILTQAGKLAGELSEQFESLDGRLSTNKNQQIIHTEFVKAKLSAGAPLGTPEEKREAKYLAEPSVLEIAKRRSQALKNDQGAPADTRERE